MNYLMLVCNDGIEASPAEEELVGREIGTHIARNENISMYGHPLQDPGTAKTVRVRGGEVLVTDGPFVETKEHIAGIELLACDTIEQAIEAAASHPLAWFNQVEVRPLAEDEPDGITPEAVDRLVGGPAPGKQRFIMLICSDGVPTDEKRDTMQRELPGYVERLRRDDTFVAGHRLESASAAKTVRVRGPHTLVTDGPFIETKEFIAGFDVIDCEDVDEAVAIAAAHPVAWFHAIEVRPLTLAMCGEGPAADSTSDVLLTTSRSSSV
jgi:hypothetical protein